MILYSNIRGGAMRSAPANDGLMAADDQVVVVVGREGDSIIFVIS